MKHIILLIVIILTLSSTALAITPDYEEIPPWDWYQYPETPNDNNCADSSIFQNVTPSNGQEEVNIGAKGVQICSNITPPSGCNITIQYQWFNWSLYFDDYMTWSNAQPWEDPSNWEDWATNINWSARPTPEDSTYWYNFTSPQTINTTTVICSYNDNVSCYTEGNYETMYFDWRINYSINCSGSFTNDTCNYYFEPETCPAVQYISPPSPNGTVCPCCSSICLGVNNTEGHNMNLTFYIREAEGFGPFWYGQTQFLNVSNGTYCFCPESMITDIFAVGTTNATITPLAVDTWYNISFLNFTSFGITGTPSEVTIPITGYYTLNYWAACYDNAVAPAGDIIAFRMACNNVEVPGSYRELQFQKQDNIRDEVSLAYVYLEAGCKVNFQYIVNSVDIEISEDGTYADYATSAFASIVLEQPLQFALKYNSTYEWYAVITDATTGDNITTDIFTFNTYPNPDFCPCGPQELVDIITDNDTIKDDSWLIAPFFLLSIFGIIAFIRRRN